MNKAQEAKDRKLFQADSPNVDKLLETLTALRKSGFVWKSAASIKANGKTIPGLIVHTFTKGRAKEPETVKIYERSNGAHTLEPLNKATVIYPVSLPIVHYTDWTNAAQNQNTPCSGRCGKFRSVINADDPEQWLCFECSQHNRAQEQPMPLAEAIRIDDAIYCIERGMSETDFVSCNKPEAQDINRQAYRAAIAMIKDIGIRRAFDKVQQAINSHR